MSRFINPVPQFWLDNGDLASSAKMYFYENKDYSTPKETYSQPDNTIPNTNPVILDGQGRMPSCFGDGLYSVKFYSADGSLQWTRDDVSLSAESGQMEIWLPAARYTINDIVKDPVNGDYYQLYGSPSSLGDQPSSSLNLWQKIVFITEYNINKTYKIDEIVKKEGFLYRSLQNNNADSPPSTKWSNLTFNDSIAGNFSVSGQTTSGSIKTNQYLGIGSSRASIRSSEKAIVSSAVFQKDTAMEISNLEIGSYFIYAVIIWAPNSASSVAGIKLRLNTGGAFFSASYSGTQNTSSTPVAALSAVESNSSVNGIQLSPVAANINQSILVNGIIEITASGQSVFIDWAQKTSDSLATSVVSGAIVANRVS